MIEVGDTIEVKHYMTVNGTAIDKGTIGLIVDKAEDPFDFIVITENRVVIKVNINEIEPSIYSVYKCIHCSIVLKGNQRCRVDRDDKIIISEAYLNLVNDHGLPPPWVGPPGFVRRARMSDPFFPYCSDECHFLFLKKILKIFSNPYYSALLKPIFKFEKASFNKPFITEEEVLAGEPRSIDPDFPKEEHKTEFSLRRPFAANAKINLELLTDIQSCLPAEYSHLYTLHARIDNMIYSIVGATVSIFIVKFQPYISIFFKWPESLFDLMVTVIVNFVVFPTVLILIYHGVAGLSERLKDYVTMRASKRRQDNINEWVEEIWRERLLNWKQQVKNLSTTNKQ